MAVAFRFVHTADLHLDSPLKSLALRGDASLAERIGQATRRAFARTVDLCLEEDAQALMIAGDLFDGEHRSMATALFFRDQLERLTREGVRVFIVRGNHDARTPLSKVQLPEGVHVFGGRGEVMVLDDLGVAVHGVSFREPKAPESLLPRYKPPVPGAFNIGLLHTSLGGAEGHDTYAPCSLEDLRLQGYQYWCLGHVHKRAVHVQEPDFAVVMPGIPQGRHINEAGPRSVTLAEIESGQIVRIEACETSCVTFQRVAVDAASSASWDDLLVRCEEALQALPQSEQVLRLRVQVDVAQMAAALRDRDRLREELRLRLEDFPHLHLEKLEVEGVQRKKEADDALGPLSEVRRLALGEVLGEGAFALRGLELLRELQAQLPPELRDSLGADEGAQKDCLRELSVDGTQRVLAEIEGPASEEAI